METRKGKKLKRMKEILERMLAGKLGKKAIGWKEGEIAKKVLREVKKENW